MKTSNFSRLCILALAGIASIVSISCNSPINSETRVEANNGGARAPATVDILETYDLGKGLILSSGRAADRAIDLTQNMGYDTLDSTTPGVLYSKNVHSYKEMSDFLTNDYKLSADVEYNGIGTNVDVNTSVSYHALRSTTFSSRSATKVAKIEKYGRTIEMGNLQVLTPQAQDYLNRYGQNQFRQAYGDAWACKVVLGAKLYFVFTTTLHEGTSLSETKLDACVDVAVETMTTNVDVATSLSRHGVSTEEWGGVSTEMKLFTSVGSIIDKEAIQVEAGIVNDFVDYQDYLRIRQEFLDAVAAGEYSRIETVYAPYNCLNIPATEYSDMNNWKLVRLVVENAYNLASIKVGSGQASAADANMKSTSLAKLTSIDYLLDHWTIDNATACNYLNETAAYQAYIDSWVPGTVLFPSTSKSSTVTGNYDTRTNTAWMEVNHGGNFIFNLTPGVTYQITGLYRKVNIQDSMNTMKIVTPAGNFTASTSWQSLNVTFTSKGNDFILNGGAYTTGRLELSNLVFSKIDTPRNFVAPTYNKVGKVNATNCSYPVESKNIFMSGLGTAAEKYVFNLQPGKKYRVTGQFIKSIKNCTTYTVGLITPVGVFYPTSDWTPFNFIFTSNGQDFYMNYSAYVPTGSSVYFAVDNLVFEQLN